mmetsp:Transcript_21330/g.18936  ORF Transcript_21330/g.18936 Transcript_21330/m.18936 type:complete len:128 (-) Transcript_21330:87-470(-)
MALYLFINGLGLIVMPFEYVRFQTSFIGSNIMTKGILVQYLVIVLIGLIYYIVVFFIPTWKKLPHMNDNTSQSEFVWYIELIFVLLLLHLLVIVVCIMFARNIMVKELRKKVIREDIEFNHGSILGD